VFTVFSVCFPSLVIGVLTIRPDVFDSALPYVRIVGMSFVFFAISQVLIASLRSVEKVRFGMCIALVTLVVNVSFNYCLIFGKFGFPALGVTGTAIGTLISRIVEFIVVLLYVFGVDK
jgi:Na+-driven multidrug efflux pump